MASEEESNHEMIKSQPPTALSSLSPTISTSQGAIDDQQQQLPYQGMEQDEDVRQSSIPSTSSSTCPTWTSSLGVLSLPTTSQDAIGEQQQQLPSQGMASNGQDEDGRQTSISSSGSSTTHTSSPGVSALPVEIMVKHILPLFTIEEMEQLKLVCREWLSFVRQYYRQLRVLDLTPWDYMVDERLLFVIIKYAASLREIRLEKCWRGVTENTVLKMSTHCPQLQIFCASRCGSLTDSAVTELVKNCKKLKELDLSSCYRITDETLCAIASHAKHLRELHVSSVYGVTDFGVSQLAFKCLSLKSLDVSYCYRVSNAGLEGFLKRSPEQREKDQMLKYLRIKDCQQVTDIMVAQLISIDVEVNNMF